MINYAIKTIDELTSALIETQELVARLDERGTPRRDPAMIEALVARNSARQEIHDYVKALESCEQAEYGDSLDWRRSN